MPPRLRYKHCKQSRSTLMPSPTALLSFLWKCYYCLDFHALNFVGFELYIQKCVSMCARRCAHAHECVCALFLSSIFGILIPVSGCSGSVLLFTVVQFLLYNIWQLIYSFYQWKGIWDYNLFVCSLFTPHLTSVFKFDEDKGFTDLLTPKN